MNLLLINGKIEERTDTQIIEDSAARFAYYAADLVISSMFGKWVVVKNRFGETGKRFSTRTAAEEFMSGHKPS